MQSRRQGNVFGSARHAGGFEPLLRDRNHNFRLGERKPTGQWLSIDHQTIDSLERISSFSTAGSGVESTLASAARLGGALQALVADFAGKFRRQVEFVVDDVFHMDAGGAGVFQQDW